MYTHQQNQTVEIKRTHFTGYSIKHTKSKKNMKNLLLTISTPVSLTSLAFTEILLRRTYCIPDDDCSSNVTCAKAFCMNNRLYIASTYFDYPNENDNYGIAVKKKNNEG